MRKSVWRITKKVLCRQSFKVRRERFLSFLNNQLITVNGNTVFRTSFLSKNELRHYGQYTTTGLHFNKKELQHIYNNKNPFPGSRTYFNLKKDGFNVLFKENEALVFKKRKHFNRKKDKEIGRIVQEDDIYKMDEGVLAVEGWKDYSLIRLRGIDKTGMKITTKELHKQQR